MRLYLIALELVSDGKCSSYGPRTSRGDSQQIGPSGDGDPRFLKLRDNYNDARDWCERQDVIDQAAVEVLALKRIAPLEVVGETRKQLEARMLAETVDLAPQQVSTTKQYAMFSGRQVVGLRMGKGLDPETGRPKENHEGDWQIEAARMLVEGYSLNAIAFKLKVRRADLLEWARERKAA